MSTSAENNKGKKKVRKNLMKQAEEEEDDEDFEAAGVEPEDSFDSDFDDPESDGEPADDNFNVEEYIKWR